MKAIVYAAKSSEDVHGSIQTQLADGRDLCEREGFEVVAEFSDEAFSAYSGNRGPGLERAKMLAAEVAAEHGGCVLIAQDADRFARGAGDAPGAADHLGEIFFAMKRQGVELWTVRSGRLDLLRAAIEGERSHDESARKSQATAAGHRRRWERGQRLGSPIPDGYRLEAVLDGDGRVQMGRDSRAIREVVLDPERARVWRRIFDLIEAGYTPGDVARTLNAERIPTGRGGVWTRKTVRRGVANDWYAGRAHAYGQTVEADHPGLIPAGRWERIAAMVASTDPVGTRARAGGRPTVADDYVLRGIATCGRCGSSLYLRTLAAGRQYRCRAAREATGLCDAPYIPAQRVETIVLGHLDTFITDLEGWLEQRVEQADSERLRFAEAVQGQRNVLARTARRVEGAEAVYERAIDAGRHERAEVALDQLARIKAEHAEHTARLAEAERRLAEWPSVPPVDDALDLYTRLREAVQGRVRAAESVSELNATLRSVLAEAALHLEGETLHGRFRLRMTADGQAEQVERLDVIDADEATTTIFRTSEQSTSLKMSESVSPPREEPVTTC